MTPPVRRTSGDSSIFREWTDTAGAIQPLAEPTSSFQLSSPFLEGQIQRPFRMPLLLNPGGIFPVAGATAPSSPPPPKWEAADTKRLLRDVILSVDSLDLTLKGMDANGGEKGCRYSEVLPRDELKGAKCQNQFEKGTKADARLEIRPVEGKDYSEIYRFIVDYDKVPGRVGITVGGFYVSHPVNQDAPGKLDVPREDPFEEGKDFRKAIRPKFKVAIGKSVANSDKASHLLMKPQGWVYDDFALATFDITKNTLLARGLTKEKTYTDLGIEPFKLPRRLDQFYDLFSQSDSCYAKKEDSAVVEPNFLHDKPPLIVWAAPENIDLEIRLKARKIQLGPLGSLTLGSGNKVRIQGDTTKTVVEIEISGLESLALEKGGYELAAKGVKAGKISLTLPPLKEIAKEMGWLERKTAREVIDACLGTAAPAEAPDRSAYLKKMFREIDLSDLSAESLTFRHQGRNLNASLTQAKIAQVKIVDLKSLEIKGIEAKAFALNDPGHDLEAQIQKAFLESIQLELTDVGPKVVIGRIKAPEISFRRGPAALKIETVDIPGIVLDLTEASKTRLAVEAVKSKGTVTFKDPGGGPEFTTRGRSEIKNFQLELEKNPGGDDKVKASVKLSGLLEEFSFAHPQIGTLKVVDTELGESNLSVNLDLPKDSSIPLKPKFSLSLATPKAKIESGHIYFVEIGTSTLEKGNFTLENQGSGFNAAIAGKLNLAIKEVDIPDVEALLKGFRLEGVLKDIVISGAGRLNLTPQDVTLAKLDPADSAATLNIQGKFEPLRFRDSPGERNPKLKDEPAGKVVKSDMTIQFAKVEVKDLESLRFVKANADLGIKPDLQELKVREFGISEIEAGGKIWAKFPLFGWLMGKFPKIGKFFTDNGLETYSSEIRFESLGTTHGADGRSTELKNFTFQLYEVGGRKQMARFRLPFLKMSPASIDTGKDPIELEMYFKDKDRGGDFRFELKDEDLSQRKRRPAK